jgi:hypothetical protein
MLVVSSVWLLAACASEPTQSTAEVNAAAAPKPQARVCDEEPVTGSRIKRCDRSSVQTMTPDEFERANSRSGWVPGDLGSPRGR